MRVAHLSDLHLGYAGGAGPGRAEDVVRVFESALARVAELGPELVVIAGDVFDHPEVTAAPIAAFSRGIGRLLENLPGVVVAVAAGARDIPLDGGHGPLTVIGAMDGVEVAGMTLRRLHPWGGKVCVTLLPHAAVMASHSLDVSPDPAAERNILVLHAEVASGRSHALAVPMNGWDYVALGSSHAYRRVGERACYSGSLERVGEDPWEEAAMEKGFVTVQLELGESTFWSVEARAAVSLAPVEATGGGTATVARRLGEALAGVPGGIDGKLLKVPVRGLSAEDLAVLDREVLAGVRRRVADLRVEALPGQGTSYGAVGGGGWRDASAPPAATGVGMDGGRGRGGGGPFRISALQARSRGPVLDLRDSRGLVALAGEPDALWKELMAGLREAFAGRGRRRGAGPVVESVEGAARVGTPDFEALLEPVLAAHSLRREEFAALWFGGGTPDVWLESAGALVLGPEAARELRGSKGAGESGDSSGAGGPTGSVARRVERSILDARKRVGRLSRSREGVEELEARLRAVREEEAAARGHMDAGTGAWLRERQDAETRLLLYRDRERELREELRGLDEAGEGARCGSCGRPLGERAGKVRDARREEWKAVVQDGRWWRRRRDQLEARPEELEAAEARVVGLGGEGDSLSDEVERRQLQRLELEAAARRLDELVEIGARLGRWSDGGAGQDAHGPGASGGGVDGKRARLVSEARQRVRTRIHGKVVVLTGGRLVGVFPELFAAWAEGRRRGGGDVAILELAARLVLAELAAGAGVELGSVIVPVSLDRLQGDDRPRALAALAGLTRRVPVVVVHASPRVVSAAPECFDFVYFGPDRTEGARMRRRRSGLGVVWLGNV